MEFIHVLNRGVDKRNIVLDEKDRVRFIHDLYTFNDLMYAANARQPARRDEPFSHERTPLVRLHSFCLMDNHYHLLLSEAREGGLSIFMKKLNMGYAKYFNEKYDRTGALWQGKYRKINIARDAHLLWIPFYIHLNPLDYVMPEWRRGKVKNPHKALEYLETYRWSSHLDYLGEKNFPSLIHRTELGALLGNKKKYAREIMSIITDETLGGESVRIEN